MFLFIFFGFTHTCSPTDTTHEKFPTVDYIPMDYFTETKTIYGRVEKVIDGDTLRVTHCPTYFTCPDLPPKTPLSEATLSIRLYGIDCPELQKKKNDPPSQPYAKQAKDYTSTVTLDKTIQLKLLKKDQYGRAVSKITNYGGAPTNDLSLDLLSRGYALMYTGSGAVYDGDENKQVFKQIQQIAKSSKVGMWSLGDDMMTPAEYKRMYKNQQKQQNGQQQVPTALATVTTTTNPAVPVPIPAVPAPAGISGATVSPTTP